MLQKLTLRQHSQIQNCHTLGLFFSPVALSLCLPVVVVIVCVQGDHLIIANLGDSRAVLCTRDSKDRPVSVQLTTDLKPDLPGQILNFSCHTYLQVCMYIY
jgi:hypothetical protein